MASLSLQVTLFCAVLVGLTARASADCVAGFEDSNGFCFRMGSGKKNFTDAQEDCKSLGGYLAEPRSASINNFLKTLTFDRRLWIGLSDEEIEGTWVWQSDNAVVTWEDWYSGHPSNSTIPNCAIYDSGNDGWMNKICSHFFEYACQVEKLCPDGFEKIDGYCFKMGSGTKNFDDAQLACEDLGGFLPEPKSAAINNITGSLDFTTSVWIGLTDGVFEGTWLWETDGSAATWYDWGPGYPTNNTGSNCAVFDKGTLSWNDTECNTTSEYACQAKPSQACPSGFEKVGGVCVVWVGGRAKYAAAPSKCLQENSHAKVLMLKDENVTDAIMGWDKVTRMPMRNFWVGLTNVGTADVQTFKWADNSILGDSDWSNWKYPVSSSRRDRCVAAGANHQQWRQYKCAKKSVYVICQID